MIEDIEVHFTWVTPLQLMYCGFRSQVSYLFPSRNADSLMRGHLVRQNTAPERMRFDLTQDTA